jgi:uncharacterized protein (TIGR02246 family)
MSEPRVRETLDRVAAAWNAGDATAYGEEFTPDATYVVFNGTVLRGRQSIVDTHRWLFDGPLKGSQLGSPSTGDDGTSIRFLRPDVAHVITVGAVRPAGAAAVTADRDSVPSYVLVEDDGRWRIAAFHNTRRQESAR